MTAILAACATLLAPLAGQAGNVDDLVSADVLDGGMTKHGAYITALRLTMPDGWKTYWRSPGDAGIPPSFDWRGSRNLGNVSIIWPTPSVFDQNGYRTIGYSNELVLPVEITPKSPGQPVRLRGEMEIGLCKDVCIPGRVSFDHQLDPQAGRNPAIAAAMAQRPYSAREAGVRTATCRLQPTEDGLRLEAHIAMPSAGGQEVAVIEPGNLEIWTSETQAERRGDTLVASADLVMPSGGGALDRSQVRITVLGHNHSVDIQGCAPG